MPGLSRIMKTYFDEQLLKDHTDYRFENEHMHCNLCVDWVAILGKMRVFFCMLAYFKAKSCHQIKRNLCFICRYRALRNYTRKLESSDHKIITCLSKFDDCVLTPSWMYSHSHVQWLMHLVVVTVVVSALSLTSFFLRVACTISVNFTSWIYMKLPLILKPLVK